MQEVGPFRAYRDDVIDNVEINIDNTIFSMQNVAIEIFEKVVNVFITESFVARYARRRAEEKEKLELDRMFGNTCNGTANIPPPPILATPTESNGSVLQGNCEISDTGSG